MTLYASMKGMSIPQPSKEEIKKYLEKWDSREDFVLQEEALRLLFQDTYPRNGRIEHILIKASSLNNFYSANIFSIFPISRHIKKLNIDKNLMAHDEYIVNKIAKVKMPGGSLRNFYSFASKYCSHHQPEHYPIFDYFVEKILMHFKRTEKFYKFTAKDLRDYPQFKNILQKFRAHFGLREFSSKEIDKYLWQAGKEYFPRQY